MQPRGARRRRRRPGAVGERGAGEARARPTGAARRPASAAAPASVPAEAPPAAADGWERRDLGRLGKDDPLFPFAGTIEVPRAATFASSRSRGPEDVPQTSARFSLPGLVVALDERAPGAPKLAGAEPLKGRLRRDGAEILAEKAGADWFVVGYRVKGSLMVQGVHAGVRPGIECSATEVRDRAAVDTAVRICASLQPRAPRRRPALFAGAALAARSVAPVESPPPAAYTCAPCSI
ncbi:MAG TPA: hypothetical protein VGQ83_39415 [Polyangia bacterium]